MQCVIGLILAVGSLFMPESPRSVNVLFYKCWELTFRRWLIDVGRDKEGLFVIADLYGGDLDNPKTREEFREIRETVEQEVCFGLYILRTPWLTPASAYRATEHIRPCGHDTSIVF